VAALIGALPGDVVFTSGATESNNLAVLGIARASAGKTRHVVTSKIEHKAVLDPCKQLEREGFVVTYVAPDSSGRVQPDALRAALRADTVLVSVMHANNEIGVIQDIRAIGEICRDRGIPFHVDAAQSVGKLPVDVGSLPVDLLSFTAHKIYGPKGIGALYVRPAVRPALSPVTFGGGQERGLRPGTLPTHQIVGFGVACELAAGALATEPARLEALRDRLWRALGRIEGVHFNAKLPRARISICPSKGWRAKASSPRSARCGEPAGQPALGFRATVLRARALGRSAARQSSLRFSFGRGVRADIDTAAAAVQLQAERLRAVSPAGSGHLPPPPQGYVSDGQTDPLDTLSPLARRYFDALPGAGSMAPGADVVQGSAGGPAAEAWVRFHLGINRRNGEGIVKAALFQAYGCPHTLAVMAWLTGQLPGRSIADLVPGTPSAWLEALEVPLEKLGRLLVVEDALRAACQQWNEAP
jgi:cysteine desulfurase